MHMCSKCSKSKDASEFYIKDKKTKRLSAWCKKCTCDFQKQRWKDRKLEIVKMFGGQCCICGYSRNLAALDFHHRNPSEKEFSWNRGKTRSWDKVIKEVQKCDLVCSNCHQEIHHPELDEDNMNSTTHHARLISRPVVNQLQSKPVLASTGTCPICNSPVFATIYCNSKCRGEAQRRVNRPSKRHLKQLITKYSWRALGRKYKVSDNAVRKWARQYDLL